MRSFLMDFFYFSIHRISLKENELNGIVKLALTFLNVGKMKNAGWQRVSSRCGSWTGCLVPEHTWASETLGPCTFQPIILDSPSAHLECVSTRVSPALKAAAASVLPRFEVFVRRRPSLLRSFPAASRPSPPWSVPPSSAASSSYCHA